MLSAVRDWDLDALSAEEVREQVEVLRRAVETDTYDLPAAETMGQRVLRRRLLTLLRAELIPGETGPQVAAAQAELLETLRKLERLRETLEPDWREYFASCLAGPDGLDLVVEVAHDLRSPLTSIMFLAETLRSGQSGHINEVQKKQLGIIYSAALGLVSVVSDMMDMARGGGPVDDAALRPLSVAEIFDSVRSIVMPMAEEKEITLRFMEPDRDRRIGHPVLLSRVLLNLITNGIKFTNEGFVEVTAREEGDSLIRFAVRDTGPGIDEETPEALYQPFRRRRGRSGFRFSGTGLGLAISRRMVEAMGGSLEVESRKDWGTEFWFTLDLPESDTI